MHLNSRKRSDLTLIFVASFGIIGGLIVFSSYAYSRPVTISPGVFSKANLVAEHGTEFKLHMQTSREYCFSPDAPESVTKEETKLIQTDVVGASCFSVKEAADVEIDTQKLSTEFSLTVK